MSPSRPPPGDPLEGTTFDGLASSRDASPADLQALVAQSQKRSAVFDIVTNPTAVSVEVG